MIELTPKSEISELIKPAPIKPAEETTPTFDLLEQVQEHEEFGLEDGVLILEDKGLKLEHIPPYPGRITGKFRVSCEDPLIEISGLGETEKTLKVIYGEAQQQDCDISRLQTHSIGETFSSLWDVDVRSKIL